MAGSVFQSLTPAEEPAVQAELVQTLSEVRRAGQGLPSWQRGNGGSHDWRRAHTVAPRSFAAAACGRRRSPTSCPQAKLSGARRTCIKKTNHLFLSPQAMSDEGLANYFTRRNREAAARLWAELLRLALAAGSASATPQLFCLADRSAVAVMQRWPDDRVGWALQPGAVPQSVGGRARPALHGRRLCGGDWRCVDARRRGWRQACALAPSGARRRRTAHAEPRVASPAPVSLQNDWHRGVALRRLAKVVPFGKWRALREALLALDKQKAVGGVGWAGGRV